MALRKQNGGLSTFRGLFLEPPKLSANPFVHAKRNQSVKIVLLLINGLVDLMPKVISYPPHLGLFKPVIAPGITAKVNFLS